MPSNKSKYTEEMRAIDPTLRNEVERTFFGSNMFTPIIKRRLTKHILA